jgi:uncharacterized membrane protein
MRASLLRFGDDLRASYWFLPTVMVLAALLLAGGMIFIDTHVGSDWMDGLPWLYAARPDGARQVLSAIGGSMITVAGTVFSVTIASVVFASGQYGPRLLANFMSDRGNQVTLGTFIATFVYCLLILRTIRSADETGGAGFVPNLALLVGVALALCSIAVLIFFIHHVPNKLHINSVIEDIGARLIEEIEHRFPRFIGQSHTDPQPEDEGPMPAAFREPPPDAAAEPAVVPAKATGYLQVIDDDALLEHARSKDLVLRLRRQPGDFVHRGRALLEAWPPDRCTDETTHVLQAAFAVGARRSALQDLRFLIDELVEVAARALSPGINDPFTAVTCLDWLGAAFSDLAARELPSHLRADEDGNLRVIAYPVTFERFLDRAFGALAQYCARDAVAALKFVDALEEISRSCDLEDRLAALRANIERIEDLAREGLAGFDLARLRERCESARRAIALRRRPAAP